MTTKQTIWRDGDRIRSTDGTGYGDGVPDDMIRRHIAAHTVEPADQRLHNALLDAVPLLYRQWEAELRAEIADEIEAEKSSNQFRNVVLERAARIARGGAQPGGQP